MAMLGDPIGGAFGLWEAGTHTGFNRYNEAGSVAWDEYHSKDFQGSKRFYETVFGWGWEIAGDTDDFRYYTPTVDGQAVGGMMDSASFLPAEVPSHWAVYFQVDSADDTVAKAVAEGATVLRPAEDTPYGRLVDLLDPTGANFKLIQELPTSS
jgi:predicted enzyme related to lactoylglutathione lyase